LSPSQNHFIANTNSVHRGHNYKQGSTGVCKGQTKRDKFRYHGQPNKHVSSKWQQKTINLITKQTTHATANKKQTTCTLSKEFIVCDLTDLITD